MGEENHDLCCVFFQTLPNLLPVISNLLITRLFQLLLDYFSYYSSYLLLLITSFSKTIYFLLLLVKRYISHRGTVGSASACQARGNGFEPGLKRYIFSRRFS